MRRRDGATPISPAPDDEQLDDVAGDEDLQELELDAQLSAATDRRGPHAAGDEVDDDEEPEDLEELVARQYARRERRSA